MKSNLMDSFKSFFFPNIYVHEPTLEYTMSRIYHSLVLENWLGLQGNEVTDTDTCIENLTLAGLCSLSGSSTDYTTESLHVFVMSSPGDGCGATSLRRGSLRQSVSGSGHAGQRSSNYCFSTQCEYSHMNQRKNFLVNSKPMTLLFPWSLSINNTHSTQGFHYLSAESNRGQKREIDVLELELEVIVSHRVDIGKRVVTAKLFSQPLDTFFFF